VGDQQPVELGALHVLAHAVVGVAQVPVAELGEAVDADRSQLLVIPRKRGSRWSRANKQRIQRLTAAGRLAPAGLAAVTDAKADGSRDDSTRRRTIALLITRPLTCGTDFWHPTRGCAARPCSARGEKDDEEPILRSSATARRDSARPTRARPGII
jgi:hypothetical protein